MRIGYYINKVYYKRLATTLITALLATLVHAQKISVSQFYLAESDLTAQNKSTVVEDQNGDKCALIRIQTTQKGFSFDVGSAGIQKIDDNHIGEIWVYVPFGVRHISIRHPQLGSLTNYDFPINIEKARTYIMEITSDKVFVNYYDDTRKQKLQIRITPNNSKLTLNGMNVTLNAKGEASQELSFGTYTYKVTAEHYYPKEGQVTINDSIKAQSLVINDLKPIMGSISIHTNPYNADIMIDGISIFQNTSLKPRPLQTGHHIVTIKSDGYKTEERDVVIEQDKTTDLSVTLSKVAYFNFNSTPAGAILKIDGKNIATTPCKKELKTGSYVVQIQKTGYKDFKKSMNLNSSNPNVNISLNKIYNYKNEFYAELGIQAGSFMAFGGSIGGYLSNFNIELSVMSCSGKSEDIYWNGNETIPIATKYQPQLSISGKLGYGIAVDTRYKITPQLGISSLTLKESTTKSTSNSLADGSNVISANVGVRLSAVISNHFGISLSPTFSFAASKSNGFKELEYISTKIKNWGEGINIKFGLMVTL